MLPLQRPLPNVLRADIAGYLRARHPDAAARLAPEDLERLIDAGIDRASGYGLGKRADIAWFAAMMLTVSPRFDQVSFIRRCLSDAAVPPDERVGHLLAWSTAEDWEEAEAQ